MFRVCDAATFCPYHGEPCHRVITPLHDGCNPSVTGFHHHLVHRSAVATDAIRSRQSIEPKRTNRSQRVRGGGGSDRRSRGIFLGLVRSMAKPVSVSDCNCNKRTRQNRFVIVTDIDFVTEATCRLSAIGINSPMEPDPRDNREHHRSEYTASINPSVSPDIVTNQNDRDIQHDHLKC